MRIEEKFESWCKTHSIKYELLGLKTYNVPSFGKVYVLEDRVYDKLLDSELSLILTDQEYTIIDSIAPDYLVFKFGDTFYYSNTIHGIKLTPFLYVGEPDLVFGPIDFPYLGIHSGYELLSGSRRYKDYLQKIKWLGSTTCGICEENTLAGVISFQEECSKLGIRSIIGEQLTLHFEGGSNKIKLYCKDRTGWHNLLKLHKIAHIDNDGVLSFKDLLDKLEGLVIVITTTIETNLLRLYTQLKTIHTEVFFQFDFTEWDSQSKEIEVLEVLQCYLFNRKTINTLLISDYYYLEKHHSYIRKTLGQIAGAGFRTLSSNQYVKTVDDYILEPLELIPDEELCYELVVSAIENTIVTFQNIDFKVLTGNFYLPKFPITNTTPDSLLLQYITEGMESKIYPYKTEKEISKYWERVEEEFRVISKGGFVDYFLILIDLYKFADREGIWYGIGRGSAAGCLISYLTGIVGIDPIEYNLFFERFLNEGRIGKSLPDIDTDWQGSRRDEIKRYLEQKYGYDQVVSIGTYGTFKLKNTVRDLARFKGVDITTVNYVTKHFPEPQQQTPQNFYELFEVVSKNKQLYDFVQKHHTIIEDVPLLLSQPKNASIHAAGIIITPIENGTAYEQLPVKKQNDLLVSEWEGHYIDEAGFLKIDVLGIRQLDKIADISDLIFKRYNKRVTFSEIKLDDQKVFDKFRGGWNEDVFQLGGLGLKGYTKDLQPDNIEDIIATVALYRPGPIESGTHLKYIKRKNKVEEVTYYPGTEEITSKTFGLIVYQEQVMQICQKIANFSLVEADDIRKALGKMKPEIVKGYRDTFLERSSRYPKHIMESLWQEMEGFAAYAFNRSHAACYAITGYYCQWYKTHYPLEFWTISLQYSDDSERPDRISEIYRTSNIQIQTVDINYSGTSFISDISTNTIYWSLPSVKFVGDKVVESIFKEREERGKFYSFEEFLSRVQQYSSSINKRAISHLIICGAFDKIENFHSCKDRYRLLQKLYGEELKEEYQEMSTWEEYQWVLKQREFTGFGFFDFESIILSSQLTSKISFWKQNQDIISTNLDVVENVLVAGVIESFIERKSKNGKFCELQVRDNTELVYITVWSDFYDNSFSQLGKTILFYGQIVYDSYKKINVVHSCKKTKFQIL